MKNRKETTFDVRYNPREMGKMREQAEAIAKEQGLTDKGEIDAFRHAYTSAKVAEDINKKSPIKNPNIGEKGSEALGDANEWWREGRERWDSNGEKGNPKDEWAMDVDNNKAGIRKNSELNKLDLSPEEKEKRLREELATAAKEGKLQTKPTDSNQKYYEDEKPTQTGKPEASSGDSSSNNPPEQSSFVPQESQTKWNNKLDDETNRVVDSTAKVSDQLASEMMNRRVEEMDEKQKSTHGNISQAVRRVFAEINSPDQVAIENIMAERPDVIADVKLKPLGDTDNDIVFGEIKERVRGEMAGVQASGGKADPAEMIKVAVNENLDRIKFTPEAKNVVEGEHDAWNKIMYETDEERCKRLQKQGNEIFAEPYGGARPTGRFPNINPHKDEQDIWNSTVLY